MPWFPSLLSVVPFGAWSCSLSRSLWVRPGVVWGSGRRASLGTGSGSLLRDVLCSVTAGAAVGSSPSSDGGLRAAASVSLSGLV